MASNHYKNNMEYSPDIESRTDDMLFSNINNKSREQHNPKYKQPSFNFGNLPIDNPITPQNVNLYLKHHGMKIVIVKFMEINASIADSLRTTLIRIIDDFEHSGKDAILFLCEYAETECGGMVDVSETIVKSTYHHRQWIDDGSNTFGKRYASFLEENN